jgi:hypothetical protein
LKKTHIDDKKDQKKDNRHQERCFNRKIAIPGRQNGFFIAFPVL